jgi:pyruvate formate lyase activating enzyme
MVIDHTDEWYYDLKFIDKDKHKEYTGVSNDLILDNLARLSRSDAAIVIRIPLVPGITDTKTNLTAIADFLVKHKNLNCVNLLPYNKFGEDKRKRFGMAEQIDTLKTQSEKDLQIMGAIFRQRGLRVKIGG